MLLSCCRILSHFVSCGCSHSEPTMQCCVEPLFNKGSMCKIWTRTLLTYLHTSVNFVSKFWFSLSLSFLNNTPFSLSYFSHQFYQSVWADCMLVVFFPGIFALHSLQLVLLSLLSYAKCDQMSILRFHPRRSSDISFVHETCCCPQTRCTAKHVSVLLMSKSKLAKAVQLNTTKYQVSNLTLVKTS